MTGSHDTSILSSTDEQPLQPGGLLAGVAVKLDGLVDDAGHEAVNVAADLVARTGGRPRARPGNTGWRSRECPGAAPETFLRQVVVGHLAEALAGPEAVQVAQHLCVAAPVPLRLWPAFSDRLGGGLGLRSPRSWRVLIGRQLASARRVCRSPSVPWLLPSPGLPSSISQASSLCTRLVVGPKTPSAPASVPTVQAFVCKGSCWSSLRIGGRTFSASIMVLNM